MSLVHTIILPLIIISNNITTEGVFVGTFLLNFAAAFPFMCRLIVSPLLQLCQCPPHSNLLIILNRRFSLGGEGHDWNFSRHVWEDERRRAQTSHLNPKWGHCLTVMVLLRYITEVCFSPFFFFLRYQMSFEEDNYEPRSDGGDSCRSVPMAIRSEEITLHSSSLK